ncbi:threonine/serine exporter family protein [Anaerosphaera multitolerans]|uniref:Threonine/serine exporter n=1 Tax=Anaerosphaera multitolerans TaxID=2487351 RepID=A0A437S7X9_9FIRM|nr:threonine/serine exporter family protein [Anaerosphaera multitolerans]RVU55176.1 threonine/serine exporter [Anaerosphaera multitolerans]
MYYLTQFLIATFAAMGFAFYFNCPKKAIITSCLFAGIAWTIFKFTLIKTNNYFLAGLYSAFILGLLGEFAARKLKNPATVFIIPGLTPMVPGAGVYYSMYYLINENSKLAQESALETFFIASSLAVGLVASLSVIKVIKTFKYNS